MNKRCISSIGMDKRDQSILQLVSSTIQPRSKDKWLYTDKDIKAEILFIDLDNPLINAIKKHAPEKQIHIFISFDTNANVSENCLIKPLRVPDVRLMLLHIIDSHLTPSARLETLQDNQPNNHQKSALLNRLLPRKTRQPIQITAKNCPNIFLSRTKKTCCTQGELKKVLAYQTINADQLHISSINEQQWKNMTHQANYVNTPLDQALWKMSIALSNNELLKCFRPHKKLKLLRWPDFGKLPHSTNMIKLATYLMTHEVSTEDIFKQTNKDKPAIVAFLNACYLSGWLVFATEAPKIAFAPITQKAEKKRSHLMSLIKRKLGFG